MGCSHGAKGCMKTKSRMTAITLTTTSAKMRVVNLPSHDTQLLSSALKPRPSSQSPQRTPKRETKSSLPIVRL